MSRPSKEKPVVAKHLVLRLYVAGQSPVSVEAVRNARALCDQHFPDRHELEIVDILEHPERALADGIVLSPTLVRLAPLPVRRVVGSLSATDKLLSALRDFDR